MNDEQRLQEVREAICIELAIFEFCSDPEIAKKEWNSASPKFKKEFGQFADKLLALPYIHVEAAEQELPTESFLDYFPGDYYQYDRFMKHLKSERWVKVIRKSQP